MQARGRSRRDGADAAASRDRPRPNRLVDEATPNVLTSSGQNQASNARPSWVRRKATGSVRGATRGSPRGSPATASGEPASSDAGTGNLSWGTIIVTGLILFSLARACLQPGG